MQQQGREVKMYFQRAERAAQGGASLRRADAAQVCSDATFFVVDCNFECTVATAARQIVSERW
jgi:hypothetical protein